MTEKLTTERAAELIRDGQCVALPTETVYGLACSALNPGAVANLFSIKGRPQENPVICHVSSPEMAFQYGRESELARRLMDIYWPGPLTILLEPSDAIPSNVTAGSALCGFRMPDHPLALEVISLCNEPLAIPSANKSGRTSPVTVEMVLSQLEGEIAGVVDGGQCSVGLESTVVRVEGDSLIILRPGIIDAERLEADGFSVMTPAETGHRKAEREEENLQQMGSGDQRSVATVSRKTLDSPGLLPVHYQPDVDLYLIEDEVDGPLKPGFPHASYETVGVLNQSGQPIKLNHFLPMRLCENAVMRIHEDPAGAARGLYLDLFQLARHSDALVVIPGSGASQVVLDRLRRAAAGIYRGGRWELRRREPKPATKPIG